MKIKPLMSGLTVLCIAAGSWGGAAMAGVGQKAPGLRSERILAYSIAPAGNWLAETVAAGSAAGESIVIRDLRAGRAAPRTIFAGPGVGSVYWLDAHHILFTEAGAQTTVVAENIMTRVRHTVFVSRQPISISAFDRARGLIAYVHAVTWRWNHRVSARVTNAMTTLDLLAPAWARWPDAYRVGALALQRVHGRLIGVPLTLAMPRLHLMPTLLWRDGQLLGVVSSVRSWHTRIFDLETGRRWHRGLPLYRIDGASASPSGRVALVSTHEGMAGGKDRCGCTGSLRIFVENRQGRLVVASGAGRNTFIEDVSGLWWGSRHRLFAQVMGYRRPGGPVRWWLEELDTRTGRVRRRYDFPGGDLGGAEHPCTLDSARRAAVCVAQTLTEPPQLMLIDLRSGARRRLGPVDPRERPLDFTFQDVRIRSRFGFHSTGWLALPRGAATRPVPLAVMAYGFSEAYSRRAQWITSYPVARLVHAGIAVLLLNWARTGGAGLSPYDRTRRAMQSAVSLFRNAVPAVEARGVRVSRAMAMGWSFGGLFVAHAIQSLPDYVAAQVGDPASYTITEYGLGNEYWRHVAAGFFGGPPVGPYLQRYAYFDPAGSGKPAQGPILFEFVSRNPGAGQLIQEWQAVGTEVEAFAYRRSVHWLSVPAEARISRARNLDWAKINLLGPASVTARQLRRVGLTLPKRGWWNVSREKPSH